MSHVGHDTEGKIHDSEMSLSQGMGKEKAGNESVQSNCVWCWWRATPGKLQHLRQLPAIRGDPLFQTLEIPFRPLLWAGAEGRFTGLHMCRWFIQWQRNNGWDEKSEVPRFWAAVHGSSSGKRRMLVLSWLRPTTGERATAGARMRLHLLQAPPARIPLSTFG